MIPANELRVGNWTLYDGKPKSLTGLAVVIGENLTDVDPIPITAELLLKCGFAFQKNLAEWANVTEDYSYYFIELPSGKKLEVYLDNGCNLLDAGSGELKSLHQLQNLYFSIVGKELEIDFK